jgi:hypothetical protein
LTKPPTSVRKTTSFKNSWWNGRSAVPIQVSHILDMYLFSHHQNAIRSIHFESYVCFFSALFLVQHILLVLLSFPQKKCLLLVLSSFFCFVTLTVS